MHAKSDHTLRMPGVHSLKGKTWYYPNEMSFFPYSVIAFVFRKHNLSKLMKCYFDSKT